MGSVSDFRFWIESRIEVLCLAYQNICGFLFKLGKPICFNLFIIWYRRGKFRTIPENMV